MENYEMQRKILQVLSSIDLKLDRLDDIANVLKISQKTSIEQIKKDSFSRSKLRQDVYKLCDGTRSVSEIAEALDRSISLVSQVISQLQEAGLVSEKRKGKTRYYEKAV